MNYGLVPDYFIGVAEINIGELGLQVKATSFVFARKNIWWKTDTRRFLVMILVYMTGIALALTLYFVHSNVIDIFFGQEVYYLRLFEFF